MPRWSTPVLAGVAGVASLALVGATGVAVVQYRQAEEAEQRAEAAEARADELSTRVEELEQRIEEGGGPDAPSDGGQGGLGDLGDLGGLLDGLMGGAAGTPGAACLTPEGGGLEGMLGEGDLEGLMEEFLGEDGQGLGDLFGGGDPNAEDGGGSGQQPDPEALVEQVAGEVAELRGLEWSEPPEVEFLDQQAMRQRLQEVLAEDYSAEDADLERRQLVALGAVPRGTDMQQLRQSLYEEQVAGFYDPESGELVVGMPSGEIAPADQVTLAHELNHALTDQALGLPDLADEQYATDEDAALGALALVEGDATLLMSHWTMGSLSLVDQLTMAGDPSMMAAQEQLDALPPYLGAELMFPYMAGMDYVCHQWQDGEWPAVDEEYDAPPQTSAEVLWTDHPGLVGEPAELTAPEGYEEAHATTFGAAPLLWLLEAPGGDAERALADAETRARAWGGGQLGLWTAGDDTAVGLSLLDQGGQTPLCDTVNEWYAAAFPDAEQESPDATTTRFDGAHQDAVLACEGEDVLLGIGPDLETAQQVVP
ncbi:hypothetical protein [Ornithinicoccus halotolerans]|uniref:hypothetical protein n=1 Tax=Ornithinicoccus halotolerans TaxID=1748220 RepID=UPI001885AFF3|nr:hypothetical protein [Ornithinicoccus halotolerans]